MNSVLRLIQKFEPEISPGTLEKFPEELPGRFLINSLKIPIRNYRNNTSEGGPVGNTEEILKTILAGNQQRFLKESKDEDMPIKHFCYLGVQQVDLTLKKIQKELGIPKRTSAGIDFFAEIKKGAPERILEVGTL